MNKLVIMQVIPDFNSGGVERGTFEIAAYLQKHKVTNFVCSNGGALVGSLKDIGIRHIKLSVNSKNPFVILINTFKIYKKIKEYGINIVHARSRAPAWSCYFACLLTNCKFITTFHGAYSATHPLKRLYNSIMLKGTRVIAISNYIKKHIETRYHFTSDKLVVIDRGADLDYFDSNKISPARIAAIKKELNLKINAKEKLLVLPARFTRLKGHIYLLKALKYLEFQKFKCLMIGKATDAARDYVREIEYAIKDNKLEDKVFLHLLAINDMPALYKISDVVISSSQEPEGFGRTIVEAQAMGKIVISTNTGAPRDIIEDGKSGFLVQTSDPSTFAETIDKVLNLESGEVEEIVKYAKNLVISKYSLDLMCQKTLKLYRYVIEEDGKDI